MSSQYQGSPSFDPTKIPLATAPAGVIPNFAHPDSRAWQVYVTASVCVAFMLAFLAARLYSKVFVAKKTSWDDYAIIVATLGVLTYVWLAIAEVQHGYGRHMWDLTLATSFTNRQQLLVLVSNCIYGPIMWTIKLSLFLLLLQIFGRIRWLTYLVWFGIVFTGLFYFAGMIVSIAYCAPKHGQTYLESFVAPRCHTSVGFGPVQSAVNIISDFYILAIPIPAVMKLQLPLSKKIGIIAIFATGFLACLTSILSLWLRVRLNRTSDISWQAINPILVAIIEMAVGVIVGCMPACAQLVRSQETPFHKFFSSLSSKFSSFPSLLRSSANKSSRVLSKGSTAEPKYYSEEADRSNKSYTELNEQPKGARDFIDGREEAGADCHRGW